MFKWLGSTNWHKRSIKLLTRGTDNNANSFTTIVTGIQPTGYPHLGNYFGMIKPFVKLQSSLDFDRMFLLIADLHALTKLTNNAHMVQSTLRLATALVACGINPVSKLDQKAAPGKAALFPQSSVVGHCELAWILSSKCTINRLAHLPQWKEKSEAAGQDGPSVGLFTYPVLQAADVLLYGADLVPVGADQTTHVELARDLARAVNTFKNGLVKVPELRLTETPKIYNLREPSMKMSKSRGPEVGTVWLTDSPDKIRAKVTKAQTDTTRQISYHPSIRPGIANLIQIYAAAKGIPVAEAVEKLTHLTKVELKSKVTDAIVEELLPIQGRIKELEGSEEIRCALSAGSHLANEVASNNLRKIKEAFGLPSYL